MNKTPMIMLLLGVAFLSACIVQNAAPATDSVAPAAPDQGLLSPQKNDRTVDETCDSNPDNYILFASQGDYEVGLKSYVLTSTSGGRGTVESVTLHTKGDGSNWAGYEVQLTSRPVDGGQTSRFDQTISMNARSMKNIGTDCVETVYVLQASASDIDRDGLVTIDLKKGGRSVAVAQGTFALTDNA